MSRSRSATVLVAGAVLLCIAAPASADQFIVGFEPGEQQATVPEVKDELGGRPEHAGQALPGVNARVVTAGFSLQELRRRLGKLDGVRYVEPNRIVRALDTPNDPGFAQQYGLLNPGGRTGWTAGADIAATRAWAHLGMARAGWPARGGAKVAIIDTGIAFNHAELKNKISDCARYETQLFFNIPVGSSRYSTDCGDGNGHGSHVAGIVGAATGNGVGVAGVAPNADLAICRALNSAGSGTVADIVNCINWSVSTGAKVISMSLGGVQGTAMQDAVRRAWNNGNGALVVAAAGNNGNTSTSFPAGYAEVVSVGATDAAGRLARFSNRNASVELAAPGVNIYSTWTGVGYKTISGTSMATPMVSGVASLLFSQTPGITAQQVRDRLATTATDLGAAGRDTSFGFGQVNAARAVGAAG